jgi:formylglycine-generating enzyme required for sulfatase activity
MNTFTYCVLVAVSLAGCSKRAPTPGQMITVPAGPFTMGCIRDRDPACDATEEPPRRIDVPAFRIDATEVTRAAYQHCVTAGACTPFAAECGAHPPDPAAAARYPVACVSWDQARGFCAWRGARLPTEAEWEKAARGSDGRTYPWGDSKPTCEQAVHEDCDQVPREVGSRPGGASPYGALDMAGNVSEWVADAYAPYDGASAPAGRVARDATDSWHMRATARNYLVPGYRSPLLGFRCAADP